MGALKIEGRRMARVRRKRWMGPMMLMRSVERMTGGFVTFVVWRIRKKT
jgi:hypothetical protein